MTLERKGIAGPEVLKFWKVLKLKFLGFEELQGGSQDSFLL